MAVNFQGGNKYVIRETLDELIELIRENRASVIATAEHLGTDGAFAANADEHSRRSGAHTHDSPLSQVVPLHPREV